MAWSLAKLLSQILFNGIFLASNLTEIMVPKFKPGKLDIIQTTDIKQGATLRPAHSFGGSRTAATGSGSGNLNDRTSKVFLGATVPAVEEDADAECDSSSTVGTE